VAPLLEVEGLTVVHEGRLSRTILDGVDLCIDDGQTLVQLQASCCASGGRRGQR
jgi:ABC-type taurine transport system ATPase subunit